MIGIINYGAGNIKAISNIYKDLELDCKVVNKHSQIKDCTKYILPGVGSFDFCKQKLIDSNFIENLNESVLVLGKPILGICVGMQLMADKSEEGVLNGLGWISGEVCKFDKNRLKHKPKIPHMGWNSIELKKHHSLFNEIDFQRGFYFVHSYYFKPNNENNSLSKTDYGIRFDSSVISDNIFGVQFHPEKSHSNGINLLKNFSNL